MGLRLELLNFSQCRLLGCGCETRVYGCVDSRTCNPNIPSNALLTVSPKTGSKIACPQLTVVYGLSICSTSQPHFPLPPNCGAWLAFDLEQVQRRLSRCKEAGPGLCGEEVTPTVPQSYSLQSVMNLTILNSSPKPGVHVYWQNSQPQTR